MKPQHTPTPWEARESGRIVAPSKDGLTEQTIARVQGYASEVEADAAHIVKCVNMHDELVNVLQSAYDRIDGDSYGDSVMRRLIEKTLVKARGEL
jgi:hypothetical protein